MNYWRAIFDRNAGAPRLVERRDDVYARALHEIDWLEGMSEALELDRAELPAPDLPAPYRAQLELLVNRWDETRNQRVFGAIQRIVYECYGLSCDEICLIESWRSER